jgi:hypothetical protein
MTDAATSRRIPFGLKLIYSGFVCVLVPVYWRDYGPTNFLYFCDVAVFFALAAAWTERPILASMPAVGILAPQALWMVDFLARAAGVSLTGMTDYMFDEKIPLFTRGLSFFHFWLPILLVWLVWRMRYDRRAFFAWTATAWSLMLVCYFVVPPPPAPPDNPNLPVNINYVFGLGSDKPQEWMPPLAYLGVMLVGLPVAIFLPTHFLLARLFANTEAAARQESRPPDGCTAV